MNRNIDVQQRVEEHFDFVKNGLKSEFPDYYTEKAIEFKEEHLLKITLSLSSCSKIPSLNFFFLS